MLTITKLKGAEYLISSVADGMEDYYMGAGEAPGVWRGAWAAHLDLAGVVGADELRALVNGLDPRTGADLLAGHRERKVRAIDVTLSVPKSVSLLWAFGTPEAAATVSIAVVEATEVALGFLEERAAFARQQHHGIRRRVETSGFAIATFAHRTSRAGDPQLHTHCLIPNVVRRADGAYVAFDANPLHVWAKATGTVFLNELERTLTQQLGVAWGPERNGCREILGFTHEQLRGFSKRTSAIETHLEASGEVVYESKRDRMRADDRASLATRERKDKALTPERLRDRWAAEATVVGLEPGAAVDDLVVGRELDRSPAPSETELFAALVDPAMGVCATESRFCAAHVVERVAAISGGRLTVEEIVDVSERFLGSELVVRLTPDVARRRPPEWSTVELRAVEDRLLGELHTLAATPSHRIDATFIDAALTIDGVQLGQDQADAARVLCGEGPALRLLTAPAGFGKTTAIHAGVIAAEAAGRSVVALAPTHKAVAELRAVGVDAQTIARFRQHLNDGPLSPHTTVIVDEISQVGTRDAAAIITAVAAIGDAQLWCVGDAHQAQSVAAGGLVIELQRLARAGVIPDAALCENRRQHDPAERAALAYYRAGDIDASRTIRAEHGWEHELATPADTRQALAEAAVGDSDRAGPEHVAVLAVSHADCEDLADRIRAVRAARGELRGPTATGPGWGPDARVYAAGDRVLIHVNLRTVPEARVFNGSAGTVINVNNGGLELLVDGGRQVFLPAEMVAGYRPDNTPNVSHAWARTADGAQGGTWHHVHLLGTPTLDRFTGYLGQSRGRQPTHTWNTRPDPDHPATLLADDRTPSAAVLDAMRRAEPKTFAAHDDPWVLDRQLRAERAEHADVIRACPPDRSRDLDQARKRLTRATEEHGWAAQGLELRERERARLGPLRRLRRGGADDIARAETALTQAHDRVTRAEQAWNDAHADVAGAETAVAARLAWDRTHAWRIERTAEIDSTLAHHWADVTLRAVRADDPLAFGIDHFRDARNTYRADLQRLLDELPPDRRDALACAEAQLRRDQTKLQHSERNVADTHAALEQASHRCGRRDYTTIERTESALSAAQREASLCRHAFAESRQRVGGERRAVQTWAAASVATAVERARLEASVRAFDDALDLSQRGRAVATTEPTIDLRQLLRRPSFTSDRPAREHALDTAGRTRSVNRGPATLDLGLEL